MSTGSARHHLRRALRQTRGRLRHGMGVALRSLLGARGGADTLDPDDLRSVLVVRINGRLGNTMFMTPLLRQLHTLLPRARIDFAVSYPHAATLLAGMPGLGRVILFPHKGGAGMAGRYLGALRALRREHYDLVIEPTLHSTNGRIVLAMSRSRHRLSFASQSQWAPLTHAVPPPSDTLHMAREPVYLLARGFGLPWYPADVRLWLPLTDDELTQGRRSVEAALARAASTSNPLDPQAPCRTTTTRRHDVTVIDNQQPTTSNPQPATHNRQSATDDRRPPTMAGAAPPALADTFGFFAHATGLKALPPSWWLEFWTALRELAPEARPVEFLPTAATPPVDPAFASLNLPAQRLLTAAIAHVRLFICADGGPMHLAGSTNTPTIGLFNGHSDPKLYGPLKPMDRSIDVRGLTPADVARQVLEAWKTRQPG